ncbi:MAG: TonB family protein [Candidatus Sulfotelmatobacter sp.]|jgi:TonB family protein
MRYRTTLLASALLTLSLAPHSLAADLKIVANPSVRSDFISPAEVRGIFLAETDSLKDGSHVEPVFERSGPAHKIFLKDFLGVSSESLQNHYGALVFTGRSSMPRSFNSDAEVVAYVAKTRGAIGYVSASASTEGVKVLEVVAETSHSGRALLTQIQPEYPETLRQLGISGIVRLKVVISPQGNVETVSLLGGNPILGESAMKAVHEWTYAAGPTTTTLIVTVPFGTH